MRISITIKFIPTLTGLKESFGAYGGQAGTAIPGDCHASPLYTMWGPELGWSKDVRALARNGGFGTV